MKAASSIDEYIAAAVPAAQPILKKIRRILRKAAPKAEETISYNMPAFRQNGILIYFAAFKNHIGMYPPIRGDKALDKALAPYRGPKGNLQFPLSAVPYDLIERIAALRVKQDSEKKPTKRVAAKRPKSTDR